MSSWYDWMVCAVSRGSPGMRASTYWTSVSATAATMGPARELVPPTMVMAMKAMDAVSVNTLGEMKPTTPA